MPKIVTAAEAVKFIADDAIVAVNSSSGLNCPDAVLKALGARFDAERHPRNLTMLHPIAAGDMFGIKGVENIAKPGLLGRYTSLQFRVKSTTGITRFLDVRLALGRFAQYGVTAAFDWTYPAADSPAAHAFRADRNFDGKGGRFLDTSVKATAPSGLSIFASTTGRQTVAVLLNFSPTTPAAATVKIQRCGAAPTSSSAYVYDGTAAGFAPTATTRSGGAASLTLRPYSITVLRLTA